ncbi:hypothetical protein J4Q44_G00294540 [Coregonus suidteri]|uniref:DDE Tnp4 domain-containing protein n=1 Tax=Coregonus suidteri TaxID=861788 RepID=A0AAN8QJR3_9TELE
MVAEGDDPEHNASALHGESSPTPLASSTALKPLFRKRLHSRGESHSHYYSSNTLQDLVAVAPCGLVMFISPAYGGRCSDKFVTQNSGFLEYLRPGDEVLADWSFTLRDLLYERKVIIAIPAVTQKGGQLSDEDVTRIRKIAN